MVGKSKDNKANKGRKALENEWELALAAANNNERLIASSSNVETSKQLSNNQMNDTNSNYIKHRAGASARERAKIFNSFVDDKINEDTNNVNNITQQFTKSLDINITNDMSEEEKKKLILKAKKKAEKEAKLEFERKEQENLLKRREEKRKKEEEELKELLNEEKL